MCIPVLCELEAGIRGLSRPDEHRRALTLLLARIRIWLLDGTTAATYGQIYQELRSRGCVLSQIDMMVAALTRQMRVTLLTADRDFSVVPDVPVENWLVR